MAALHFSPEDPLATAFSEAAAARTATGDTIVDMPPRARVATVVVNVTAVTGTTPTMTVALQQQDANGVWYQLGVTSSITATGVHVFSAGPGTSNGHVLGGALRLVWTIGGTTPSFTFQASVQGR